MPTYSALALASYPPDDAFKPVVTNKADAHEFGFHFHAGVTTSTECVFDNCAYYSKFPKNVDSRHLLQHYELLYAHGEGHLNLNYYIVPWILVDSNITSAKTINLRVTPYSVYKEDLDPLNRDKIKKKLVAQARTLKLVPVGSPHIKAYWKSSDSDVTISEADLQESEQVRIVLGPNDFLPGAGMEVTHWVEIRHDTTVLGKVRISFVKLLNQPICFLRVEQDIQTGKYQARFLTKTEIPPSFDDQFHPLHETTAAFFRQYGINLTPAWDMKCLDSAGNILISSKTFDTGGTTMIDPGTSFTFASDLTPDAASNDPHANAGRFNELFEKELFSKIATYKYTEGTTAQLDKVERARFVVLLPWGFGPGEKAVISGFVQGRTPEGVRLPFTPYCIIVPAMQVFADQWTAEGNNVSKISYPYLSSTIVHEICHSLTLRHTFFDDGETEATEIAKFQEHFRINRLSAFGVWLDGPVDPKTNLFEMIREHDLRTAVVDKFLVGKRGLKRSDYISFITGMLIMMWTNDNVYFQEYATDNIMDYSENDVGKSKPIKGVGNISYITPVWKGRSRQLYRYQWEQLRAAVQFLLRAP